MLLFYNNLEIGINSYVNYLDSIFFCINLYLQNTISYLTHDFLLDLTTLSWSAKLLIAWFHPFRLDNLYNYHIADQFAYTWLYNNNSIFDYIVWSNYNLFFQLEKDLYFSIATILPVKSKLLVCTLNSYYLIILTSLIKYSFFFIFFFNLIIFSRNTIKKTFTINNIIFSKFFIFLETEEEVGSVDDALYFISLFIILFSWYFLTTIFFMNSFITSLNFILIGFFILVFFVLCIPLSSVINFGLLFATYIRGVGKNTNTIVEVLFDLIGTLVVFIRFIVQNIRFILIFWAYFELFEWIYNSPFTNLLQTFFNFDYTLINFSNQYQLNSGLYYLSVILLGLFSYLYYFLHLLILILIQLGAYFLISFWLFFFFYTSFYMKKPEKFFMYKRYLSL